MLLLLAVKEKLTILEQPNFELVPESAGLDQVRTMVRTTLSAFSLFSTYLYESLVTSTQFTLLCREFGLSFDLLHHDWPVTNLALEPPPVRIIAVSMPERPRLPARPFDLACSIRLETRLHSTD